MNLRGSSCSVHTKLSQSTLKTMCGKAVYTFCTCGAAGVDLRCGHGVSGSLPSSTRWTPGSDEQGLELCGGVEEQPSAGHSRGGVGDGSEARAIGCG